MSAAEKLKTLHEERGWPPYDRKVGEALLVVVEAAELITDEVQRALKVIPEPIPANAGAGELRLFEFCVDSRAALAALDKALRPPTGGPAP